MPGKIITKFKNWLGSVFETKMDILTAVVLVLFLLVNILKIALFNQILVPNADKWMLRYKLITTFLVVVITYPVLFRFKSRALFVTFYLLQLVYILVNLAYYLYFHDYLHIEQFISNFYEGFTAVQNSSGPKSPLLLVSILDLPFFIYLALYYFKANRLRKKLRYLIYIAVILSLCTTTYMEYRHYQEKNFLTDISKNMFLGESRIVQRYGTLINNGVSIYNNKSTADYIKSFKYGKEQANKTEKENKPNIFVIQVESMDASIVREKHDGSYVMPYLNSLTQNSVYYPYVLSYHLGGGTSDSEFSVINSVEPIVGYPSIKLTTYQAPNSFVSRLDAAGYEANAFHGNVGRFYNRDVAFHKFGFKDFYDIARMGMKDVGWGAPDADVFNYALEKSKEMTQPFLTYTITMTSHGPFTNASNYYNNPAYNDIQEKLVKDYFNSMSYVDESIKAYVQKIQQEYANAYIFIWGDHTPKIESKVFKQSSVMIDSKLYEFVPFIAITPDKQVYNEQKNAATFLDVAPTILNASGIKFSILSDGTNLLEPGGTPGKIPYRGIEWDRAALFEKISAAMKQ